MNHYIVWHDNGVNGQRGYSEEETESSIEQVIAEYTANGCTVHRVEAVTGRKDASA